MYLIVGLGNPGRQYEACLLYTSGKTSFLSFTIQQDYFHTDGKTLLILCEEGEEEYDPAILKANNTVVEVIENEEDFTTDRLVAMDILHQPRCV